MSPARRSHSRGRQRADQRAAARTARTGRLDRRTPVVRSPIPSSCRNRGEKILAALGVEIERRVELVGLAQDGDGVTAERRHANNEIENIRVSYLTDCDGAHARGRGRPDDAQPVPRPRGTDRRRGTICWLLIGCRAVR